MKLRTLLYTVVAVTLIVALVACAPSTEDEDEAGSTNDTSEEAPAGDGDGAPARELSLVDAARAYREFEYMSSAALFLLFEVRDPDTTSISSEDGTLTLLWEEVSPDLNRGLFTVELDGYAIPEESPFSTDAVGYVFDGVYEYDTRDLQSASISANLQLSHEDPDSYPAGNLALDISGIDLSAGSDASGDVIINGTPYAIGSFADVPR